jgi:hypothetical protein
MGYIREYAVLPHEEHGRSVFEKGLYLKASQVEYSPCTNPARWTED